MENNELTAREIFEQLKDLQKGLTDVSRSTLPFMEGAITAAAKKIDEFCEEELSSICEPFDTRETSILTLVHLYEKMYNDAVEREGK